MGKVKDYLVESSSGGVKADGDKPKIHMIPEVAIEGMARAFMYGAKKYDRFNYRKGIEYTRLADATMRHLLAFLKREEADPESGLSHLDHALASVAMLKYMTEARPEMDDRYVDASESATLADAINKAVKEMECGFSYAPGSINVVTSSLKRTEES